MPDDETIEAYNREVNAYMEITRNEEPGEALSSFLNLINQSALQAHPILDLGCGPANSSNFMRQEGFKVDPVDASSEMVALANATYGIGARLGTFDEIDSTDIYGGVWANFSLLHAPKSEMPKHLVAIHRALKTNGVFHIALKLGEAEKRDRLGRMYTYYSEPEIVNLLENNGFDVVSVQTGEQASLTGDMEPWITLLCQRI